MASPVSRYPRYIKVSGKVWPKGEKSEPSQARARNIITESVGLKKTPHRKEWFDWRRKKQALQAIHTYIWEHKWRSIDAAAVAAAPGTGRAVGCDERVPSRWKRTRDHSIRFVFFCSIQGRDFLLLDESFWLDPFLPQGFLCERYVIRNAFRSAR